MMNQKWHEGLVPDCRTGPYPAAGSSEALFEEGCREASPRITAKCDAAGA